jgi:hypothetical protein
MPFSGSVGRLFDAMLKAAGIERKNCLITNVFNLRPVEGDLANLLVKQKEGMPGWPRVKPGLYLPEALAPELTRLYGQLEAFQPTVIICLGSVALWSLTGCTGLANRHGFLHSWKGIPVIPTYHPASIQKKYINFLPAVNDIRRGVGFAAGEIDEEKFKFKDEAFLPDIIEFRESIRPEEWLSVDIETKPKYRSITCIGLGTSESAICVQFWDPTKAGQNFWPTPETELAAMNLVAGMLRLPNIKILQNALYDIAWLKSVWGMEMLGPVIDTRLMHFAMCPELPHNLAEIAGTFLTMRPWKATHSAGVKDGDSASAEGGE